MYSATQNIGAAKRTDSKGHSGRRFGRRSMTCHVWIQVKRQQRMPCILRNISADGALLEFSSFPPPENSFRLTIDADGIDAICDVRHRRNNAVGVSFERPSIQPAVRPTNSGNELVQAIRNGVTAKGFA